MVLHEGICKVCGVRLSSILLSTFIGIMTALLLFAIACQ